MKPKTKLWIITWGIIVLVLFVVLSSLWPKIFLSEDEKTVKCISEKTILYVETGSLYSDTQEKIFGKSLTLLKIIDCFYEPEKCVGIQTTPSWRINGKLYSGMKTLEELKELTGC